MTKILLLTYKALNGFGPVYIRELLHLKQHKRETRSSHDFLMLQVPRTRLKTLGDRTFSFTAATHWNALPLELRSVPSLSVFKQQLTTFLFKRSYTQINFFFCYNLLLRSYFYIWIDFSIVQRADLLCIDAK